MPIAQPKKISERWLEKLKAEIALRESEAARLGMAFVEYERIQRDCLKRIDESIHRQKGIGESAIADAGLDPKAKEYTIMPEDGRIVRYSEGKEFIVFDGES